MVEDIINKNNQGECVIYTGKDGRNIYDIVDAFKETFEEFYKAEQRRVIEILTFFCVKYVTCKKNETFYKKRNTS